MIPNEVIHLADETLIHNFEVDFQEEEEVTYAGGIKGIRALRVQRDLINEQVQSVVENHAQGDRFGKYDLKK